MTLTQHPVAPNSPCPIYSIGTGMIVETAHFPAYKMMGWDVQGLYDVRRESAEKLATKFGYGPVFASLSELVDQAPKDCVFDIAVPGVDIPSVLRKLPNGAFALLQKPMGETLGQAKEILSICEERDIHAAVNFQLRWAPYTLALKDLIASGALGDIHDLEFHVNVFTPWAQWYFLERAPRMEMVYHSIHYIDLARHLFGEPDYIQARAIKDPRSPKLESSRSVIYLDYGDWKRAVIHTYHGHVAGARHQDSYLKIEGTLGVAKIQMGLNMDYPQGRADFLEYWIESAAEWVEVSLEGSWFPHAFRGPMADMMRWRTSPSEAPSTEVHDALKTMKLVDLAYQSSDARGLQVTD